MSWLLCVKGPWRGALLLFEQNFPYFVGRIKQGDVLRGLRASAGSA